MVCVPDVSLVEIDEVLIVNAGHHEGDADFRCGFLDVIWGNDRVLLFGKPKEILLFCLVLDILVNYVGEGELCVCSEGVVGCQRQVGVGEGEREASIFAARPLFCHHPDSCHYFGYLLLQQVHLIGGWRADYVVVERLFFHAHFHGFANRRQEHKRRHVVCCRGECFA